MNLGIAGNTLSNRNSRPGLATAGLLVAALALASCGPKEKPMEPVGGEVGVYIVDGDSHTYYEAPTRPDGVGTLCRFSTENGALPVETNGATISHAVMAVRGIGGTLSYGEPCFAAAEHFVTTHNPNARPGNTLTFPVSVQITPSERPRSA